MPGIVVFTLNIHQALICSDLYKKFPDGVVGVPCREWAHGSSPTVTGNLASPGVGIPEHYPLVLTVSPSTIPTVNTVSPITHSG